MNKLSALLLLFFLVPADGQTRHWVIGGEGGESWTELNQLNILLDDFSVTGSIQPRELDPEVNLYAQLKPWFQRPVPLNTFFLGGQPRAWRGTNFTTIGEFSPMVYVDGDVNTFNARVWFNKHTTEFYTFDPGGAVPLERIVTYPAPGNDETGEPYANYAPRIFEVTASLSEAAMIGETTYTPLDTFLGSSAQNYDSVIEVRFPLQYIRFVRWRTFPDFFGPRGHVLFEKLSYAEVEAYGRGFVPSARFRSNTVDLGEPVTFGRVFFHGSKWRKEQDQLVPAPESAAAVGVQLKAGTDDTALDYLTWNDQDDLMSVSLTQFLNLRERISPTEPQVVGWRGPIVDDRTDWSSWSGLLRESGGTAGLPSRRYFQVQVDLTTDELWEFARLDSLVVEYFPLLVDGLVAEVALAEEPLSPEQIRVPLGESVNLTYLVRAEFTKSSRTGFDALHITTPSLPELQYLEMGDPPTRVDPDSVLTEESGMTVYLPRRIEQDEKLLVGLSTTLYTASAIMAGEVFDRKDEAVRQQVESGDAGAELASDRLHVVAGSVESRRVLDGVNFSPRILTPNGDGANDRARIDFTLFGVMATEVEISVHTVTGATVYSTVVQGLGAGPHSMEWDGLTDTGESLDPGLYLCKVAARTSSGDVNTILTVALAY